MYKRCVRHSPAPRLSLAQVPTLIPGAAIIPRLRPEVGITIPAQTQVPACSRGDAAWVQARAPHDQPPPEVEGITWCNIRGLYVFAQSYLQTHNIYLRDIYDVSST